MAAPDAAQACARESETWPHFGQPSSARRSCRSYRLGAVRPLARDCPWDAPFLALPPLWRLRLRGADEEAGCGFFANRALLAVQLHRDLARGGLGFPDFDLAARDEALVVEPVQELAVVLRQPDDRRPIARGEVRQWREL